MNLTQNDPLRFLKPRKKQFHLTPTKPVSDTKHISPRNLTKQDSVKQNVHIISNKVQNERMLLRENFTSFISNQEQVNQEKQQKTQILKVKQNHSKKIVYQPLKYFSASVEAFLIKKDQSISSLNNHVIITNKAKTSSSNMEGDDRCNQNVYQNQLKANKKYQEELKIITTQNYLKNGKTKSELIHEKAKPWAKVLQNQSKQPIIPYFQQQKTINSHQNCQQHSEKEKTYPQQTKLETSQKEGELKRCATCQRSFNPSSYEKHIKVCEKVFFKKRKQFSSEKQRSLSRKK